MQPDNDFDAHQLTTIVTTQILLSIASVVSNLFQVDNAYLDSLISRCEGQSSNIWELVRSADTISANQAASLLSLVLGVWAKGGHPNHSIAPAIDCIRDAWPPIAQWPPKPHDVCLRHMLDACHSTAEASESHTAMAASFHGTANLLHKLASALDNTREDAHALRFAKHSSQIAALGNDRTCLAKSTAIVLQIARKQRDMHTVAQQLYIEAHALTQSAISDSTGRIAAFDAWERTLRFAMLFPSAASLTNSSLARCVAEGASWLAPLQALDLSLVSTHKLDKLDKNSDGPDTEAQAYAAIMGQMPVWPDTHDAHITLYTRHGSGLAQYIDRARRDLLRDPATTRATTSFTTMSFRIDAFANGMPSARSMLRHDYGEDLILLLAHETIHVSSLLGQLGAYVTAMRLALVEMELVLSAREPIGDDVCNIILDHGSLRSLSTSSLANSSLTERAVRLARVDQQLGVVRKLQLLERHLTPWLEGIAVFGELGSDPRSNASDYNVISSAITNLFDGSLPLHGFTSPQQLRDHMHKHWAYAENALGSAQDQLGTSRLRAYLVVHGDKYFSGYVAVRSVVAAWRRTLQEPLTGERALFLLLKLTSLGPLGAFDASLPTAEFEVDLRRTTLDWLVNIRNLSKADLKQLLAEADSAGPVQVVPCWVERKLALVSPKCAMDSFARNTDATLDQARRSARASSSFDVDATNNLASLLDDVDKQLSSGGSDFSVFDASVVGELLGAAHFMPVGQSDCLFWMLPSSVLFVLCRTMADASGMESKCYNNLYIKLDPASYDQLKNIVQLGAPSRMRVTRITCHAKGWREAMPGDSFIALQLEDWFYVCHGGMKAGIVDSGTISTEVAAWIRNRLTDPKQLQFLVLAVTEDFSRLSKRAVAWIDEESWRFGDLDMSPWAASVRKSAIQVTESREEDELRDASYELLRFALGDICATSIMKAGGLGGLPRLGVNLDHLLSLIVSSARSPVPDSPHAAGIIASLKAASLPILEVGPLGIDFSPCQQ